MIEVLQLSSDLDSAGLPRPLTTAQDFFSQPYGCRVQDILDRGIVMWVIGKYPLDSF